jgi:hypothetical protein
MFLGQANRKATQTENPHQHSMLPIIKTSKNPSLITWGRVKPIKKLKQ